LFFFVGCGREKGGGVGGGWGGADNLTKVIMGALKEHGGFFNIHITTKLISFGVDGVNVF